MMPADRSSHAAPRLRATHVSARNRIGRVLWTVCWLVLYRPSPRGMHGWRRALLRLFGASIAPGAHPYPSARIWAPWNLSMARASCLGDYVDCYCVDRITLEERATVSQYSYLCGATRDCDARDMPLLSGPIVIGRGAWVAADVFVAPGVVIGENAVVGARASVFRDIPANAVAMGNPAKVVRSRHVD
jgi:putative colanic acid biosynthesis acetyltransferase WcaF